MYCLHKTLLDTNNHTVQSVKQYNSRAVNHSFQVPTRVQLLQELPHVGTIPMVPQYWW